MEFSELRPFEQKIQCFQCSSGIVCVYSEHDMTSRFWINVLSTDAAPPWQRCDFCRQGANSGTGERFRCVNSLLFSKRLFEFQSKINHLCDFIEFSHFFHIISCFSFISNTFIAFAVAETPNRHRCY